MGSRLNGGLNSDGSRIGPRRIKFPTLGCVKSAQTHRGRSDRNDFAAWLGFRSLTTARAGGTEAGEIQFCFGFFATVTVQAVLHQERTNHFRKTALQVLAAQCLSAESNRCGLSEQQNQDLFCFHFSFRKSLRKKTRVSPLVKRINQVTEY